MAAVAPWRPADVRANFNLRCVRCEWRCEPAFLLLCPACSGALEPELSLSDAHVGDDPDPARAYRDFLPLNGPDWMDTGSMIRTPCRPAPALGRAIGVPELWLKNESVYPTGTTKDRMAAVVLAVFRQFGIKEFVSSSTGNSSTALARAVQNDGSMRAHFFCGDEFVKYHDFTSDDRISLTVVEGNYATASKAAQEFARERGLCWEGGYFNWARREGLKIAYLEAFDEMDGEPAVVVQAISSGMGMAAAYKGVREFQQVGRMSRMPQFLMVQQDTCAPMAQAWAEGRSELTTADVIDHPTGLATAILLGDGRATYPYMAQIASASAGGIIAVDQQALIDARRLIAEQEGLDVCYSAAATVAGLRTEVAAGRIDASDVVLVNLTGRHR